MPLELISKAMFFFQIWPVLYSKMFLLCDSGIDGMVHSASLCGLTLYGCTLSHAPCPIVESTVSFALTGLVCAYHAKLFSMSHPNLLCKLWFLLALLLSGPE